METRHEACSAEGQPRNILATISNRFAGCCRVLSRGRHGVIHSCYAFWSVFVEFPLVMPGLPSNLQSQMDRRIKSGDDTVRDDRAARAAPAGLTMLQRGAEFCTDPEQAERDQQKWNPVLRPIALLKILKERMILSPNRSHLAGHAPAIFINSKPQAADCSAMVRVR